VLVVKFIFLLFGFIANTFSSFISISQLTQVSCEIEINVEKVLAINPNRRKISVINTYNGHE